jgi:hypothetical protein
MKTENWKKLIKSLPLLHGLALSVYSLFLHGLAEVIDWLVWVW